MRKKKDLKIIKENQNKMKTDKPTEEKDDKENKDDLVETDLKKIIHKNNLQNKVMKKIIEKFDLKVK